MKHDLQCLHYPCSMVLVYLSCFYVCLRNPCWGLLPGNQKAKITRPYRFISNGRFAWVNRLSAFLAAGSKIVAECTILNLFSRTVERLSRSFVHLFIWATFFLDLNKSSVHFLS